MADCDLFLGIILPRYGSGKEKKDDPSITHEELREAIRLRKRRWILAHDHVVFARTFLANLGYKTPEQRATLKLKATPVFEDLRLVDTRMPGGRSSSCRLRRRSRRTPPTCSASRAACAPR